MFFSTPFLTLCLLSSVIAAPAPQNRQIGSVERAIGTRHRFQTRDWLQQPAKRQDPNQAQREQAQHEKERQEQQQREQAQHEQERQEQRQREQAQNGGTATGQTTNGQTTNGQTTNNQPTTSQPATNQPATNQPAAKQQFATTGGKQKSQKLKSGGSSIPEVTNSETLNSETTNPGGTSQSQTTQPETSQSEGEETQPETSQSETSQPETSQSNNGTTTPAKTTGGATGGGGSSAGGTGVKGTHHAFGGPGSCEISDGSKTDGSANHLCAVGAKGGKWDISPNPDYHQRPSYCNKKITITNKGAESDGAKGNVGSEGQSTTCTVVDSYGSDSGQVDISDSAWKELTGMEPGILMIDWQWLDDPHSTEFLSSGGAQ